MTTRNELLKELATRVPVYAARDGEDEEAIIAFFETSRLPKAVLEQMNSRYIRGGYRREDGRVVFETLDCDVLETEFWMTTDGHLTTA